jgi:hypothetical protein
MFQSTIDIIINNQCSNIELTSPIYFIKDTTCHIHFPQQVNSMSIMKANFATNIDQDTFGGALLYHLQQKEVASINVQLLVIWGCKSYGIYSHTWIIKHESTLVWDKDKLKKFYNVYDSTRDAYPHIGRWKLDDNTGIKTKCEISHEGFEMKVTISREEGIFYIMPPRVNPNK